MKMKLAMLQRVFYIWLKQNVVMVEEEFFESVYGLKS